MMWMGVGDSSGSPKPIRIVVVGEKGSGKSSLIMAAARNTFHPNIPSLLPYTNLPSEIFPDRIPATVIDTSSRPEDKGKVVKEVKQADAIVLTFAFDKPETLDRLSKYWLPLFRQLEVRVPIIVAGYEVDNKETNKQTSIEQITSPMMQQYREVETSIQWSAQRLKQATKVLYYAQKAVIHPVGPVFNQETNSLKPRCIAALKRIFLLSDHNMDGILSDAELNELQKKCFDTPLVPCEINQMKKAMQVKFPQGVNERGLTLDGFLFLNTRYIEEARIQTLWTMLRKFGYNNDLRLGDDLIPYSSFKREADQSVELTNVAIEFLREVYEFFDNDGDNNLEPHETGYIFETAPESPWTEAPYKDVTEDTKDGGLSLEGFLSLWSLMTLIDPARSLEYLMYIRFPYDPSSAIRVTRKRVLDRKEKKSERKVVQCLVFGPKNAGKSALLNQFTGRSYDDDSNNNNGSTDERYAVNMVKESGVVANTDKTLVLKEIRLQEDGFMLSNKALAACDVAVFIYDSSDESSWNKAIDLLAEVATIGEDAGFKFPCLMVAAKSDLDPFPMAIQESTRVTQDIGIDAPIPISSKLGDFGNLFRKILTTAEHPHLNIPEIESKKKRSCKLIKRSLMAVSIGTAALIAGLASFRLYTARKLS
ncbi:EF-hand domain pair [Arabidopsis thaliana x Arabidopsis arenosa]|uniref:Mitochondrial Rho GTPase n=1 Tax=Arabidopsis thaliana x Arabidopsis arenosa TaxID=1240361 RepID=A0A8T2AQ17_9BRAS|nr:EF-hand domain pair [Arabidopsis thaliana x Arabidopsis arenosa]